jgi:hypothetical protein
MSEVLGELRLEEVKVVPTVTFRPPSLEPRRL